MRVHPMWRKTPLLLFRWPPILTAIGTGICVMVVALSVAPMFLSSAASGALRAGLRGLHPASAGFSVTQQTPWARFTPPGQGNEVSTPLERHAERTDALARATEGIPHIGPGLESAWTSEATLMAGQRQTEIQPLAREGFRSHIEVEEETRGEGVWLARSAADALKADAGDELRLQIDSPIAVRVKGIYSDLAAKPVTDYWHPVDRFIHAAQPKLPIPPPPLLMNVSSLLELGAEADTFGNESWEFPLEAQGLTLHRAREVGDRLLSLSGEMVNPSTELGSLFGTLFNEPTVTTTLPEVERGAAETVVGVESPVQVLALIGALVALVLITISAHYVVQKRSIEFRLLVARGVSDAWIAARGIGEAIVPSLLFGSLGGLIGWALIATLGPGPIDVSAIRQAIYLGAGSLGISLGTLGVATALAARRKTAVEHPTSSHETGFPWEIVLLVLAGAALYLIGRNGAIDTDDRSGGRVDILLVLFPLLGISGAALFLLRLGFGYLNRARDATARSRTSVFLAMRRLAAASRSVMLFVGAAAVSVGMLVYSTGLVSSVRATTYAKTHVFVGSDVSVVVSDIDGVGDLGVPHTIVTKFDADVGNADVDVMGVQPDSFAAAAYWDDDFAARSLSSLLEDLQAASVPALPVIAVGGATDTRAFTVLGNEVPVEVVGTADTWPGVSQDTTMLVTTRAALAAAAEAATLSIASAELELWAKGPTDQVLRAMETAGIDTQTSVSARDVAESSALLSISWTFGLLRVLGIVAGLMSIVGILLYVASRHRVRLVSYLIGRRMGLGTGEHRSALLIELLTMLVAALALGGALGLVAVRLIYRSLDLLPTVPPAPLFRVPASELVAALLAFIVAASVGSRWIQRSSDAARPGEVMRLAD